MSGDRRRVSVTVDANVARYLSQLGVASAATKAFAHDVEGAGHETGILEQNFRSVASRLKLALDLFGAFGPALVPIGAVAVPAVTGLANAFGMAALSGGTAILAFQGVGDALTKVNKANLDPTEAHIEAARLAMSQLSEESQKMVEHLAGLKDELQGLRDASASGLFPGLNDALDTLLLRIPEAQVILRSIGEATGNMAAAAADDLTSDRWDEFFSFLAVEAPEAITGLAQASGNLAHALTEMWMAFNPLNEGFTNWMVSATAAMDDWAMGLSETEGFQEFIAYVNANGPMVADTLGSIAMMLLKIMEAAAPIGSIVLPMLGGLANAIEMIADSDLGTPLMGLIALTSAMRLLHRVAVTPLGLGVKALTGDLTTMATTASKTRTAVMDVKGLLHSTQAGSKGQFVSPKGFAEYNAALASTKETIKATGAAFASSGAMVAGFLAIQSGVPEQMGLTNTVLGATIGLMAGWQGAMAGGLIGGILDLAHANDELTDSMKAANEAAESGELTQMIEKRAELIEQTKQMEEDRDVHGIDPVGTFKFFFNGDDVDQAEEDLARLEAVMDEARDSLTLDLAASGVNAGRGQGAMFRDLETDALAAAFAVKALKDELIDVNALLERRAAIRDYEQSVDDFTKSVEDNLKAWKKNGAHMDRDFPRWRELEGALDGIAVSAQKATEDMKPMERIRFMKNARQDFMDAAEVLGYNTKQAGKLANALGLIGRIKVKPDIEVDTKEPKRRSKEVTDAINDIPKHPPASVLRADGHQALGEIHAVNAALASIDPFTLSVIQIRTEHMDVRLGKPSVAGGGLMIGPGTGTSDSIPANLSNGEFVMKASAVRKHGVGTFQRLNMAAGGPLGVGPGFPMPGGGSGDPWGMGSDAGGSAIVKKIIQALLGSSMGAGKIRAFGKELDELQRDISKYRKKHPGGGLSDELKEQARELAKEVRKAEEERLRAIKQENRQRTRAMKEAFANFDADLAQGAEGIHDQVASLKQSLREAGGVWSDAMERHATRIESLSAQYDVQAGILEGQESVLNDLTAAAEKTASEMASFIEQVQGNFDNDPFGTPQGLAGVFAQLATDTTRANAFNTVLQQLKAMGLDGPAFQALAASGDLVTAQQLAASGMIDPFEQAFAERTAALSAVGTMAGDTVFGQQVANQNAAIARQNEMIASTQATMATLQAQVVAQTAALYDIAARIDASIRAGSYDGTYNGIKDGVKGAGQNGGRGSGAWTGGQVWAP